MRNHQRHHELFLAWLAPTALAGLCLACGGGDKPAGGAADTASAAPATPPPMADTAPAGGAQAPSDTAAAGAQQPSGAAAPSGAAPGGGGGKGTPAQIALGDSIFHGQAAGGTCYACHGQDAKGSGVGPNLTDSEWLNTDGTLDGIVKTIKSGVPQPKKAPAPMPPMGGATLSDAQVQAAAAYVYSLSH
jgi:mono/diheme cytochrome c family protein